MSEILEQPAAFRVGEIVTATSVGDSDCVWYFRVERRTAKQVTLVDLQSCDSYRVGIRVDDAGEWTLPFGRYSFSPIVRATLLDRPTDDGRRYCACRFPRLAVHPQFSQAWYELHRDHHLAIFPDVDAGTRSNLQQMVDIAADRAAVTA